MPCLLSLLFLATPSVNVSADRLEATRGVWRALGAVKLTVDDWALQADRAQGSATDDCPRGHLSLEGPVLLRRRALAATARAVEGCLSTGSWAATGVRLTAPRLALSADVARVSGDTVIGDEVVLTACGCADAPWRVTASRVELVINDGAWMHWPVLWLGPVPIAAAPRWYVPHARRRTGLLVPHLTFDGEAGFGGQLPIFWTLGQSADLTLEPGWRQADGPIGALRLRWAAGGDDRGRLHVSASGEGARVWGAGALPWGPTRVNVDADFTSSAGARARLADTLEARRVAHTVTIVGLNSTGANVGLGGRALIGQDLRPSIEGEPGGTVAVTPELWLTVYGHAEGYSLALDLSATRFDNGAGPALDVLQIGTTGRAVRWLGPLRARLDGGVITHTAAIDSAPALALGSVSSFAALDLQVEAARVYGALTHRLTLGATPRWAGQDGDESAAGPVVPVDSAGVELRLTNRWGGPTWASALTLRAPYDRRTPVDGWGPVVATLTVDANGGGLQADATTDGDAWIRGGVEVGRVTLEGAAALRGALTPSSPWRRRWGRFGPARLTPDAHAGRTGQIGGAFPVGSLTLRYDAVLDLDALAALEHRGEVIYVAACECLTITLRAGHQVERRFPDLFLTVGL